MPAPTTVRGLPGLLSIPLYWLYRGWCASFRRKEYNSEYLAGVFTGKHNVIGVAWHDELFCLMTFTRQVPVCAVVSRSHDGDWLAALLHRLGMETARGSSSRGGLSAMRELTEAVKRGLNAIITVDGPKGPRHKVKPGAIRLAAHEKIPLQPCRVFMDNSKKFRSWDRFQLPMPFSRVTMVWGEPYIPVLDADDEQALARACADLEARLEALRPPDSATLPASSQHDPARSPSHER